MAEKIKITCDNCGKHIYQYKTRVEKYKHHFCNKICYGKWRSENIIGEKHPDWKAKIDRVCPECGKKFKVFPSKIKRGRGKFCSKKCYYKAKGGRVDRICEYCGNTFSVHSNVVKRGEGVFCSKKCQNKWQSEHFKGRNMKHLRKKQHLKPTKPERIFEEICKKHGLQYKYTGDGSFWIGKNPSINPDFVECNGKKIAIEIFGDYWHSPLIRQKVPYNQTYKGRKKILKKYGWELLVFWGIDLLRKDAEQFVLNKLRKCKIL